MYYQARSVIIIVIIVINVSTVIIVTIVISVIITVTAAGRALKQPAQEIQGLVRWKGTM